MIGWRFFYFFYFVYRCACSVAGQLIVVRLTSLGDSVRYQGNAEKFGETGGFSWLFDSTQVTEAIGMLLAKPLANNAIAINFCFQAIAFYGIYRFLRAVPPNLRKFAALLMLAPSFNLWSSVASKEAIIVFSVGIVCSYIVEFYCNTAKLGVSHFLSGALLAVYKPHYLVSLAFVYLATQASRFVRQREALLLMGGLLTVSMLYLFLDRIDDLSFQVVEHFLADAGFSTREAFWIQRYDVFWRAPYGMFLSFVGPTFEEALRNPLQMVSLAESSVILVLIVVYLIVQLPRMPAYCFFMSLFSGFWLLFANYPFGVMNPGSAIRYRTGYFIILLTALVILSSRRMYLQWRSGAPMEVAARRRRFRFGPSLSFQPSLRWEWRTAGERR